MFPRRRIKWFGPSLKALLLSWIFLFIAKMFLKGAEKQNKFANKNKAKVKVKN